VNNVTIIINSVTHCRALRRTFIETLILKQGNLHLQYMRNSLFTLIAVLLIAIWAVVYFVFNYSGVIHILLVVAGFMLLIRLFFNKAMSKSNES